MTNRHRKTCSISLITQFSSVQSLSHVQLYVTPWTAAHQAPPSLGLSRQEHWSGLPFPSPRWTWVWVNSGSWWWTGRPGMLWFTGSQRVGHDWATKLNWTELKGSQVGEILPYSGDGQPFVLSRPGTDWVRPTLIRESNLLYSIYLCKC